MDSNGLKQEQLEELKRVIERYNNYVRRCLERMDRRQFPHNDRLRTAMTLLHSATHSLCVTLHYMICERTARRVQPENKPTKQAYFVDCVMTSGAPLRPLEHMDRIEAETPLEVVAKLVRHGRAATAPKFYARVALTERDGYPDQYVLIPLNREAIVPHSVDGKSTACAEGVEG